MFRSRTPFNELIKLRRFALILVALSFVSTLHADDADPLKQDVDFPFQNGDRVAWIGSSSTHIGVWCRTMEFLLRTRHPELKLTFYKGSTGSGTFATGVENLPKWLAESSPTLVFFNYGANDAKAAQYGIARFKHNMLACVEMAKSAGARVVLLTPQSGDIRMTGVDAFAGRKLYAQEMIAAGLELGLSIIDIHHPTEKLQRLAQKETPAYSIDKDTVHFTDSAYVAWGYFLYKRLNPPVVESCAEISADGKIGELKRCTIDAIQAAPGRLAFVRSDEVLPLLPPEPIPIDLKGRTKVAFTGTVTRPAREDQHLPPRKFVPELEACSRYMLKITGLEEGTYSISCNGLRLGTADSAALAAGVNLNSILLDSGNAAPWLATTKEIWSGKTLDQIGKNQWKFVVAKAQ